MDAGVIYVAYGANARREAGDAITALHQHTQLPVSTVSDAPIAGADWIQFDDPREGARWAKLNLDSLTPYAHTLYMDADTRAMQDVGAGFTMLNDGWELVIAPSVNQHADALWHVGVLDRTHTTEVLCNPWPLQLQAGVFWFANTPAIQELFAVWREEWLKFNNQDQGALLRALDRVAVKTWILSTEWNSRWGAIVQHWFGRARG